MTAEATRQAATVAFRLAACCCQTESTNPPRSRAGGWHHYSCHKVIAFAAIMEDGLARRSNTISEPAAGLLWTDEMTIARLP